MDPWSDNLNTSSDLSVDSNEEDDFKKFEDNFKPDQTDYQQLPDSEQYLAILESKLERIKNDPNILKQLADKREACMQQLLSSCTQYDEEALALETPVNNSAILRTIAPQRTALNQGEVVELVKYDQLTDEEEKATCRN